jgi:hypothetical protein
MSSHDVNLSAQGPPETILVPEPPELTGALDDALAIADPDDRRAALVAIVAAHPTFLDGWARIGQIGRDPIERYAAFRVGYHRGLDRLRQSGWRGTGYVRWTHESNRGFLRALEGLQAQAAEIGETAEADRCAQFLLQLDPTWPPDTTDR